MNLEDDNQLAGFTLGLVLNDNDLFTVKTYMTDDDLEKAGEYDDFSAGLSFGRKRERENDQ
ncbi:MAG: hypothetical protein FJY29_09715 [Betaproteobacteria bacterium]|nr:hypothetical protein [Betaproteobacteria bacterium]